MINLGFHIHSLLFYPTILIHISHYFLFHVHILLIISLLHITCATFTHILHIPCAMNTCHFSHHTYGYFHLNAKTQPKPPLDDHITHTFTFTYLITGIVISLSSYRNRGKPFPQLPVVLIHLQDFPLMPLGSLTH